MKTTIKFLLALVTLSMVLFTSCIEDPDDSSEPPVITINTPTEDPANVFIGDTIEFDLTITSLSNLVDLKTLVSVTGVELINHTHTFSGTTNENVKVLAYISNEISDGTEIQLTFTAQNTNTSSFKTKTLLAHAKETPLSEASTFEWKREGGSAAVGLEEFGLLWTSNSETTAIIRKDAAKFVELDSEAWENITTLEALVEAIDAAEDMERWEKISVTANKEYDIVLGTINEDKYYLIHISSSTVSTSDVGTTITVFGEYKE